MEYDIIGAGLAILGIGFPTGVAIMKLLPNRESDSVTDKRCFERSTSLAKLFDTKVDNVNNKIDTLQGSINELILILRRNNGR